MKKKTWRTTERQGGGRRYWFDTPAEAEPFAAARERAGFLVDRSAVENPEWDGGSSVWVSYAKRRNVDAKTRYEFRAGIEYGAT